MTYTKDQITTAINYLNDREILNSVEDMKMFYKQNDKANFVKRLATLLGGITARIFKAKETNYSLDKIKLAKTLGLLRRFNPKSLTYTQKIKISELLTDIRNDEELDCDLDVLAGYYNNFVDSFKELLQNEDLGFLKI